MRVGRHFVDVVDRLGRPQRVREVAIDRLQLHRERGAGLSEFLDQATEEFPDRAMALEGTIGGEEDRVCGVVRDEAFEISLGETPHVPLQNFLGR